MSIFPPIVKIAGVWIEIKKGNITTESVRGIVNTTNNQMNLTGGVCYDLYLWFVSTHIVYSGHMGLELP